MGSRLRGNTKEVEKETDKRESIVRERKGRRRDEGGHVKIRERRESKKKKVGGRMKGIGGGP